MIFIIPQNYKYKNRILGIIDYPTAVLNIIWNLILYLIIRNIPIAITSRIFIFSALSFPILLLTIFGFNNESPLFTIKYIIRYLVRPKVYLFDKTTEPDTRRKHFLQFKKSPSIFTRTY